jgi:hypothetical protein
MGLAIKPSFMWDICGEIVNFQNLLGSYDWHFSIIEDFDTSSKHYLENIYLKEGLKDAKEN